MTAKHYVINGKSMGQVRHVRGLPKRAQKLPKTFRGVHVARGKGLNYKVFDRIEDEHAFADDEWPGGEFYLVVADRKNDCEVDGKVFSDRAIAVKYAKACANGNVDYRVLRCTSELLVIATENDL